MTQPDTSTSTTPVDDTAVEAVLHEFASGQHARPLPYRLAAALASLRALYEKAGREAETTRMQLVGCSVAAYGGDTDGCAPEYRSDALEAVIALRAELADATRCPSCDGSGVGEDHSSLDVGGHPRYFNCPCGDGTRAGLLTHENARLRAEVTQLREQLNKEYERGLNDGSPDVATDSDYD